MIYITVSKEIYCLNLSWWHKSRGPTSHIEVHLSKICTDPNRPKQVKKEYRNVLKNYHVKYTVHQTKCDNLSWYQIQLMSSRLKQRSVCIICFIFPQIHNNTKCWKKGFFSTIGCLSAHHVNGKKVVSFGAIAAVWCDLCCAVQWSVIPSGHASKQDVDLLMWFCVEGVWQVCHRKCCWWRNSGTQKSQACVLGYGAVLTQMAQDTGSYLKKKKKKKKSAIFQTPLSWTRFDVCVGIYWHHLNASLPVFNAGEDTECSQVESGKAGGSQQGDCCVPFYTDLSSWQNKKEETKGEGK